MARDILGDTALAFSHLRQSARGRLLSVPKSPNTSMVITNVEKWESMAKPADLEGINTGGRLTLVHPGDIGVLKDFVKTINTMTVEHVGVTISNMLAASKPELGKPKELNINDTFKLINKVAVNGLSPIDDDETKPYGRAFSILEEDGSAAGVKVKAVVIFDEISRHAKLPEVSVNNTTLVPVSTTAMTPVRRLSVEEVKRQMEGNILAVNLFLSEDVDISDEGAKVIPFPLSPEMPNYDKSIGTKETTEIQAEQPIDFQAAAAARQQWIANAPQAQVQTSDADGQKAA